LDIFCGASCSKACAVLISSMEDVMSLFDIERFRSYEPPR
jgi:hypothetical protein